MKNLFYKSAEKNIGAVHRLWNLVVELFDF